MKPPAFRYSRPGSLTEAVRLLAEHGPEAKVLAGGQSLIPLLSMRLAEPARLIDINALTELDYRRADSDGVRIGALARHSAVLADAAVTARQPLLAAALRHVAHPTIRNRGTSVGSIVHADPAGELPAVLSVLGGSVSAVSAAGRRTVEAGELFAGPLETTVRPDELVVEAFFPALTGHSGTAFAEVSRRHGDYALCGVATLVTLDDDLRVLSARAGYLSMAATPQVLELTEPIAGRPYDADLGPAAEFAAATLEPEGDIHASADYRRQLARVLTGRTLAGAARKAARA
ncbi:MAG TPA: FAD binding domain-containing protein [Jatrophihabitans sp.]|nr:FAD binding domain-containing protein [Jatrophihabitans sp.]